MKKIIGIVAEYNPLHEGHKYQLSYAKENSDAVIVAMSGDFVQRGIPAVLDKYNRAEHALKAGADMIISMPVVGSTAGARDFAHTGVGILNATNLVSHILFGVENGDNDMLVKAASILSNENEAYKEALNTALKNGDNFAQARTYALNATGNEDIAQFIKTPNNILGTEYISALQDLHSSIKPITLTRNPEYDSSSTIREKLKSNTDSKYLFEDDFSLLLHEALVNPYEFSRFYECSEDLSARIKKLLENYVSVNQFADLLKTKNITRSRIMRCLCHILLGIETSHMDMLKKSGFAPYIHILGIRNEKQWLLKDLINMSKAPVFTSLTGGFTHPLLEKDILAANLHRVVKTQKSATAQPSIMRQRFLVV